MNLVGVKVALQIGFFLLLLTFAGMAAGGLTGAAILCGSGGVLAFVILFSHQSIILRILKADLVGPCEFRNLFGRVQVLAHRMGMTPPRVYILPHKGKNAMALGRAPSKGAIVVTKELLFSLKEEELNGVIVQQLSNIQDRVTFIGGVSALLAWGLLAFVPKKTHSDQQRNVALFLFFLFAPLAAAVVQLALQKDWEFKADAKGVNVLGSSKGLTSALYKMDESMVKSPLQISEAFAHLFIVPPFDIKQSYLRLFLTHPSTETRIEKLSQLEISLAYQ